MRHATHNMVNMFSCREYDSREKPLWEDRSNHDGFIRVITSQIRIIRDYFAIIFALSSLNFATSSFTISCR